jgi:hypothetical protein
MAASVRLPHNLPFVTGRKNLIVGVAGADRFRMTRPAP